MLEKKSVVANRVYTIFTDLINEMQPWARNEDFEYHTLVSLRKPCMVSK